MDLKNKVFIDAVFTSPERDTIEVIWGNPDNEEMYQEYVQVDPKDKAYLEVLELGKINFDDIIDATAERNRQQRRDFEISAIRIGQEEGWIPKNEYEKQKDQQIQIKTERQLREEIYKDISNCCFSSYMLPGRLIPFFGRSIKSSRDFPAIHPCPVWLTSNKN